MIPPERQPVTTGFFGYNKPISPTHREGEGAERGGARGRPTLLGMYDWLIPSMAILGVFIPPPGGVIMADFFIRYQGRYPVIGEAAGPRYNRQGLAAYTFGSLAALMVPGVPSVNGIAVASLLLPRLT